MQSEWDIVNGLRLHRRTGGQTREELIPFVLVHGLVISSLYMIPLGELLSVRRPVHALDMPGFGKSRSSEPVPSIHALGDTIIEWLSVMQVSRCHLVANSMGCQVAAHVAVKAPQ